MITTTIAISHMHSQVIKAAGQGWFSGQIPADAQRNLIKGTMTEVVFHTTVRNGAALDLQSGLAASQQAETCPGACCPPSSLRKHDAKIVV
ncbi:Dihydrolipoamide succinyltransferase [Penicillium chrysogenum]|uniref:Dihydrolipoamide succinyltransferase n=1 Tax=Penicillium chrysogenum TaxID=5076 RepID=UPI0024DF0B9B|nr:Dihydrolipoamide succinyltransferase [Penicillium chrysogenum]KAJ5249943.1 Dihydrolipoamide succinyltransferase [Penicillium chrysogenum]KAJ6148438.1 Dihydrolipoamide succinyltransferase [Penicillium chrysogenum]